MIEITDAEQYLSENNKIYKIVLNNNIKDTSSIINVIILDERIYPNKNIYGIRVILAKNIETNELVEVIFPRDKIYLLDD